MKSIGGWQHIYERVITLKQEIFKTLTFCIKVFGLTLLMLLL